MGGLSKHYDVLVAGSGFGGSLMSLALRQSGFKVCLVDRATHPRFAIGESSTPIADMILRTISNKYDLPWLYPFSRYGSWQASNPDVACGLKRGFSYFKHTQGKPFTTDVNHSQELLVAASVSDDQSDTHWFRANFDAFLVEKVKEYEIDFLDQTEIISAGRKEEWTFEVDRLGELQIIKASFLVDATGGASVIHELLGVGLTHKGFRTDSFAIFSHFDDLPRWGSLLNYQDISLRDYPFDPDHSALHQVLEEGWVWMLRFNNERSSVGLVLDNSHAYDQRDTRQIWRETLSRYPSVWEILRDARMSNPPNNLMRSGRLQRRLRHCYGDGWVALPHTAGFIDPLHSTGIAFSLAGIEKIAHALREQWENPAGLVQALSAYEHSVFEELDLIDLLVAGCYKTLKYFELFTVWTMLYFTAAIAYEQRRMRGQDAGYFLAADDPAIRRIITDSYVDLIRLVDSGDVTQHGIAKFVDVVRHRIRPYNSAGLLDPSLHNMYRHSAVEF